MSSKANIKPNAKPPEVAVPPVANSPKASVPISLYREIASELNSNKTKLESLRLQNQELTQQNQQLRIEIERVVQSALQLRQLADSNSMGAPVSSDHLLPSVEVHFEPPTPAAIQGLPPIAKKPGATSPNPAKQFFTEEQPQQRRNLSSEKTSELGGVWLILAIVFIVVTAFGTGFLIVRPLLPHR